MGHTVVAVEPLPMNAELLQKSVAANCNFNVSIERVGLAEYGPRRVRMSIAGSSPAASTLADPALLSSDFHYATNASRDDTVSVMVETADALLLPRLRSHRGAWAIKLCAPNLRTCAPYVHRARR